jgi:hypothetical protein
MALISPADQQRLRESFAEMKRPVRLLFFTQTLGCETCPQTRQILDELPPLSTNITIEEVNFILDADRASEYGIDRVPAVALAYEDTASGLPGEGGDPRPPGIIVLGEGAPGVIKDSRIKFLGTPAGYEFISLVQAILLVGGGESILSADNRARVTGVAQPVRIHVFTTPS